MTPAPARSSAVHPIRALRRAACGVLLAAGVAQAQDGPAPFRHRYEIPAQRLGTALAHYSQVSGVDVLLDEPRAADRRSATVEGSFSSPQALTLLLRGTGLVARFTSARSAVIVPEARARAPLPAAPGRHGAVIALDRMRVTATRTIGAPRRAADPGYVFAAATQIRAIVVASGLIGPADRQRLRIQTRIADNGTLHALRIARPSGDRARDARIVRLLEGHRLDAAPPPGLRQPILFDVVAR